MPNLLLGHLPPPTAKEKKSYAHRLAQLRGPLGPSVAKAVAALAKECPGVQDFRVRGEFAYRLGEVPASSDDRAAPPRNERPPSTGISSSRGMALGLELLAIATAQIGARPGQRAQPPGLPIMVQGLSWTDLVASSATYAGKGRNSATEQTKKARSLVTAIDTLQDAGLVKVAGRTTVGGVPAFTLLNEAVRLDRDPRLYTVPGKNDWYFTLPAGLVTQGWIHVLNDSEIALLLMLHCGRGSLDAGAGDVKAGEIAIPADERLRRYGIHRDPFTSAHRALERFGLIEVREIGRHTDGRTPLPQLHRMRVIREGLGQNAVTTMVDVLEKLVHP